MAGNGCRGGHLSAPEAGECRAAAGQPAVTYRERIQPPDIRFLEPCHREKSRNRVVKQECCIRRTVLAPERGAETPGRRCVQQVERSQNASAVEPDAQTTDGCGKDIVGGEAQQEFSRPGTGSPIRTESRISAPKSISRTRSGPGRPARRPASAPRCG
ncbi:hypothetical protein AHiyo8_49400 [Arthrobacter sp. Hiyo8]|nr:hypothetical protein AHiyo8_49400 [Arthrobacter sp. Hiyo8]